MFWHWYRWLIKCQCFCYCRQEMVDTANYRHLVPGVSVIKGLHLYEFAPKGRDFVFVVCVREGAYYRGFFRGNVWEFCWYVGNCPYWRGVRISEVSVWRGSTVFIFFSIYFFIYFISLRGRRWKGKGKGEFFRVRERVGRARGKGKERLQGRHCFGRFLRSDFERKNSDWGHNKYRW